VTFAIFSLLPPSSEWDGINPLDPHYLVYVKDDGSARLGFGQPKPTLEA
jgi:hypothetical protein